MKLWNLVLAGMLFAHASAAAERPAKVAPAAANAGAETIKKCGTVPATLPKVAQGASFCKKGLPLRSVTDHSAWETTCPADIFAAKTGNAACSAPTLLYDPSSGASQANKVMILNDEQGMYLRIVKNNAFGDVIIPRADITFDPANSVYAKATYRDAHFGKHTLFVYFIDINPSAIPTSDIEKLYLVEDYDDGDLTCIADMPTNPNVITPYNADCATIPLASPSGEEKAAAITPLAILKWILGNVHAQQEGVGVGNEHKP